MFSKTNGFRNDESIRAGNKALVEIAQKRGWGVYVTENSAVFNPEQLARFDAVIWANTSGDILTEQQRKAFKDYLEQGGSFVGIHGAGGDGRYKWGWYADTLIGAKFTGHTIWPIYPDRDGRYRRSAAPGDGRPAGKMGDPRRMVFLRQVGAFKGISCSGDTG